MKIERVFLILTMAVAAAQLQAGGTLNFAKLPLYFEPNRGQAAREILFVAKGPRNGFFFKSGEVVSVLATASGSAALRMRWAGQKRTPIVEGGLPLSGKSNYLIGNNPKLWKTGIEHYRQVRYRSVWPGVDLLFYGTQDHLEYDVQVSPGADPAQVEFVLEGAERIEIDSSGELVLHTAAGPIRHGAPRSFQQSGRHVTSRYVLRGKNKIGFEVGPYDPSQLLTIDPTVATLYEIKGSEGDFVRQISRDTAGNIYLAGHTDSANFPIRGGVQGAARGSTEIFVAKLNPQGNDLIYSTLIGGRFSERCTALAVDSSGNAYVTGQTFSTDFPALNPFQATAKGDSDALLFKLNAAGSALVYSTYFGGTGDDTAAGIAVDGTGSVVLAGTTSSADFPTRNPFQPGPLRGGQDAFLAKFAPSGSTLMYSSYLGGNSFDAAADVTLDAAGNAYLTGSTNSSNFPTQSPLQAAHAGGGDDAFICKVNSAGSALLASTYLGGSGFDQGQRIALDAAGNVYVAGITASTKFPTRNPQQAAPAGGLDGFVCKLDAAVTAIVYSTYLGGSAHDSVFALAMDASGNAFVAGRTSSNNFPLVDAVQPALSGEEDAFISIFNPDGSELLFSTFLGGGGGDACRGIALIPALSGPSTVGRSFVSLGGLSASGCLLALETYPQGSSSGATNVLVAELLIGVQEPPVNGPVTTAETCEMSLDDSWTCLAPTECEDPQVGDCSSCGDASTWSDNGPATSADPVATATGEFVDSTVDMLLGGPLRLGFGRYYGTLLGAAAQARSFYNEADSPMGANWVHNFLLLVRRVDDSRVTVYYYQGKTITFRKSGNAWAMAQPSGAVFQGTRYQLVESGTKLKMLDPRSATILTFEFAGLSVGGVRTVESISDRNGNTLTLTYGSDGTLQKVADGLGRSLEFSYAVSGGKARISRVADQTGRAIQFQYDGVNLKSSATAAGRVTSYTYTGKSLLETMTRPAGNVVVRNSYGSDSRVVSQADGAGNTTRFEYAAASTKITDPLGNASTHSFNAQLRLTSYTDAAGKSIQYGYDSSQRQASMTDRLGDSSSTSYDNATGKVASRTDASGKLWRYVYTTQTQDGFTYSVLARREYPDNTREDRVYDAKGNLLTRTDRAGKIWAYSYNAQGQVTAATNPVQGVWTYTYNPDATLASIKDPANNTTLVEYDDVKRPRKITRADSTSLQYGYDADDRLLTRINENDKTMTAVYDDNGNVKTVTNELGKTWTFTYDANDQLTRLADPLGAVAAFTYDSLHRLKTRTDPNGNTVAYNYDARGRLTSMADGSGKTWARAFDDEGVAVSAANPLGQVWQYASDKQGRITSVTNPVGNQTRLEYDALSRLISLTNPLNEANTFSYDARGLLSQASQPGPIRAAYARNDLGRITQITDPRGKVQTISYDNLGRMTAATDALGNRTTVEYDKRSRPARVNFPQGNLDVAYESVGLVKSLSYSDNTRLDFGYDAANRLISATGITLQYDEQNRLISSNGIAVARDAGGRITSMTLAPGKVVSYAYDSRNLLVSVTDWAGAITRFSYDDAGRLTTITRANGVVTTYAYDAASRLIGIVEAKGSANLSSTTLTRDAAGRTRQAAREAPLAPKPSSADRTQTFNDADQIVGWSYDSRGRLSNDSSGRTYTWDLASRLGSYREGTAAVSFTYDAFGNRITRQFGNTSRTFVWNYALGLPSISLVKEGEITLRYYVHTPGGSLLYSIEEGGNSRRYYHYDEMGSALFLSDDAGSITDRYAYSPYGELVASSGATDNPFTFIGQLGVMAEGGAGLYYMRARYYDSRVGRFVSRDPEGLRTSDPKSTNPYQYAGENPALFVDPTGREEEIDAYSSWVKAARLSGFRFDFVWGEPQFVEWLFTPDFHAPPVAQKPPRSNDPPPQTEVVGLSDPLGEIPHPNEWLDLPSPPPPSSEAAPASPPPPSSGAAPAQPDAPRSALDPVAYIFYYDLVPEAPSVSDFTTEYEALLKATSEPTTKRHTYPCNIIRR